MSINPETAKVELYYQKFRDALAADQIILPTLPEIALMIRDIVESDRTSAQQVAEALAEDASISAQLIKVVNSPLYRSRTQVTDLQMAVSRLGMRVVRDLVTSLAMKHMFHSDNHSIEEMLRGIWTMSVEVSAICRTMASFIPGIDKEQAMLAGLIHNIGSLPIILLAEKDNELLNNKELFNTVQFQLQGRIGAQILEHWHFPESMIEVAGHCNDFGYTHEGEARLVDIVQVALLQGGYIPAMYAPDDSAGIAAFSKLGMNTETISVNIEENMEAIENAKQSLLL